MSFQLFSLLIFLAFISLSLYFKMFQKIRTSGFKIGLIRTILFLYWRLIMKELCFIYIYTKDIQGPHISGFN